MLQTAYALYPWLLDLSKPKDGLFRAVLSFFMVILAISLWHLWFVKKSKKIVAQLPPGPRGLPIVGYLPFLGTDNLHLSFTELAATYGPIFKLWLGNKLCVVISSPELAKEVVRDHDVTFSERDPPIAAQVASFGCNDIAFDSYSNPRWKNKRKVLATELLTNARLNACYGLRREQVMNGLKDVYENVGKPIDIGKWTYLVALNVAISMILGGELPGEKGAAIEGNLKENSSESMVLMGKPNVSDIFPAIARFDIQGIERGMRKINQQFNRLLESVIEVAIDKEKDMKSREQKLGFLELLLHLERNNNEDNASPLTMDEVKGLVVDILVGGTDTTTTMVEWTMAVLMQHPEIMEKVKKELSDVVGVNNTVEEFHLSNLSYLNVVIKETFRLHPALPLLVPRCPARSVHLNGYTIPKGSRLFINMWCIHRDPRIWENPLEFRPERFLNDPDNSNHYGNDFRFMPFGSAVVQIESNFTDGSIRKSELCSEVNGVGESEKSDNLDVSVECSKFEEIIEDGTVRGQNLSSNIQVMDVDSGNGIVNGEEAKDHENSEQKSLEEEPSSARIAVMTLDGQINDGYNNKDGNDREKEEESRGGQEQIEDIAVSDVNEASQVVDHDSPTKQKKEKQLEIHVGGLHKEIVEQDLFEIFGKFGEVQRARIVRHRTTKKSKGFAFIQYATTEQAKKALSDLKDGIEVKGKLAKLSISHDRDVLYLGRICRTWTKEDVLGKLKGYGIENIDEIQVPNDPKDDRKIKGFAFLRFNTFSDAKAALHRLRKPDIAFGNARGAKIAFARTPMHPRERVRLQVKTIYVEGIPKSWDVHKLKEICEQYVETKKVKISRNLSNKGKDFGFISFTTRGGALACVEGMNKLRYGGNVKVKAYIARPLVQVRLQKSSCLGLKFSKRHRKSDWLKMKGHARSKGVKKESDVRAATVIYKSKIWGTKEKPAAVVYKNNQDPLNSKHTIEGKRNEQQSIAPETHDAEDGLSTKPKKTDFKSNNRKRQRNSMHSKRSSNKPEGSVLKRERNHMHSKRSSNKPEGSVLKRERNHLHSKSSSNKREGTSQGRHIRSSRSSKSRSYVRKGHGRGADSIAYRIPVKEAYAPSTSGYPGSAHGAFSGSKRPSSYMESHAGFAQPVKHNDQYLTECIAPAFHHQRQAYAGYLKLDHYERQPPAKYFKPAIGNDALPHAGFLESSFRKQSFDGARRIAEYSGPDNQGPVHGSGSAYSRPYVPNNLSYAGYEGNSNGGGYHRFRRAYTARQAHY